VRLRPPNAANSEEELRQVWQLDLPELSPSQLEYEIWCAARIAERDPGAFVWRGVEFMSARQWASERIKLCRDLLAQECEAEAVPAGKWSPWES
jgi:hypothetical protein